MYQVAGNKTLSEHLIWQVTLRSSVMGYH